MAKKVKKATGKPKKKSSPKKNKSGKFLTRFTVFLFVIVLAFFMIFSIFKPSAKKTSEAPVKQRVETETKKEAKPVETKKQDKAEKKEGTKDNKKAEEKQKKAEQTTAVSKSIQGTWQSTTGGAFLTMDGKEYRLDFMGVDGDEPIIGTYSVDGDIITFVNKKDPCKDVKGLYEVKFDKNEIGFKCKSDECTKRKATLPTEWEWLNTGE